MGRKKRTDCQSPVETSVNGELPEDSTYFKDYSLDVESLRVQWGLLSLTTIQEIDLSEDEMSAMLLSQLDLRDTFIESLIAKLDGIVDKGRGLEADYRSLMQKIWDLEEEKCNRKAEFDVYQKQRDRSDSYSLNVKNEVDADALPKNESDTDSLPKSDRLEDIQKDERDRKSSPQVSREKSDSPTPSPSRTSPSPSEKKREASSERSREKISTEQEEKDKFKAMVAMAIKAQGYGFTDGLKPDRSRDDVSSPSVGENKRSSDVGWNIKGEQSISEQVAAVASESVIQSGYVYQEELGLYYDHTSGYYYNAEDGLYYDPKTGTYFYFDHTTQSYQFHSQVPVEGSSADTETGEQTNVDAAGTDVEVARRPSTYEYPQESLADIPPSIRLMVTESGVDKVKVGELHIVTMNGGKVGRKPDNLIQLLDVSVSKEHAEFIYHSKGHDDHHYFIKDLGSNLGTYINGICICVPGEPSDEIEIGHGWELQFGSVKMKCHIHPGYLSCNECEPGLVLANLPSQSSLQGTEHSSKAQSIEKTRLKLLKAMKKKYAINAHVNQAPFLPSDYEDRAKKRRKEKGSDNPYEKTEVASTETELKDTNKGYEMLTKMGWSKGTGLGKSQPGIIEPIEASSTVGRGGLGYGQGMLPPTPKQIKRKKILDVTSYRFKKS